VEDVRLIDITKLNASKIKRLAQDSNRVVVELS